MYQHFVNRLLIPPLLLQVCSELRWLSFHAKESRGCLTRKRVREERCCLCIVLYKNRQSCVVNAFKVKKLKEATLIDHLSIVQDEKCYVNKLTTSLNINYSVGNLCLMLKPLRGFLMPVEQMLLLP